MKLSKKLFILLAITALIIAVGLACEIEEDDDDDDDNDDDGDDDDDTDIDVSKEEACDEIMVSVYDDCDQYFYDDVTGEMSHADALMWCDEQDVSLVACMYHCRELIVCNTVLNCMMECLM